MLSIATLSIIIGAIGVGINFTKLYEKRINEELAIPPNSKKLTIELAKGSSLDLQISHSNNPTLHLSESGFVPSEIDYQLTEKKDGWHLYLEKQPLNEQAIKIGVYASAFKSLSIQLPKQISDVNIIAPENQQSRLNLSAMNLEQLKAKSIKANLSLYNVETNQLNVSLDNGQLQAEDLLVYNEAILSSMGSHLTIKDSKLLGKSKLATTSGNIQVFASDLTDATISNQKGLINYEHNKGKATISNQYGDIYLTNPQNTSKQDVQNQTGNIYATVLEKQQETLKFAINNQKTKVQAFKKAQIISDITDKNVNASLQTESGNIQIMRFMIDKESLDDDFDEKELEAEQDLYYHLDNQGISDNQAKYLSFNTLYYASEPFVTFP